MYIHKHNCRALATIELMTNYVDIFQVDIHISFHTINSDRTKYFKRMKLLTEYGSMRFNFEDLYLPDKGKIGAML